MTDFADLGIRADSTQVVKGTKDLEVLTGAAIKADGAVDALGKGTKKAGVGVAAGAKAATGMAKATKSAAGQTANLTAQLNDIGVMLAAGQNPMQLALQQGTQINQVFAQMGGGAGALRGIGAAFVSMINPLSIATIGIIAFGAAGVKALREMWPETVKLEDALEDLGDEVSRYQDYADQAARSTGDLYSEFGKAAGSAKKVYTILADISRLQAIDAMAAASKSAAKELRSLSGMIERLNQLQGQSGVFAQGRQIEQQLEKIAEKFGLTEAGARGAADAIDRMREASTAEDMARAQQDLFEIMGSTATIVGGMPEDMREMVIQLGDAVLQSQSFLATSTEVEGTAREIKDLAQTIGSTDVGAGMRDAQIDASNLRSIMIEVANITSSLASKRALGLDDIDILDLEIQYGSYGQGQQAAQKLIQDGTDIKKMLDKAGDAAVNGGRKIKRGMSEADKAIKEAEDAAKKYTDTMSGYFVDGMNDAVDWMLDGFKGGLGSLWKIFTSTIKQMIAFALKNQIMLSMGIGGSAIGGAASAATGAGGGLLGGIFGGAGAGIMAGAGGIGGAIGGIAQGIGGIFSGGGLGASFANLGGLITGASSGFGAIGAAIPAIGLIVLGLSAIIGKTRKIDEGLSVSIDGLDAVVKSFVTLEKSQFFGLFKSKKTKSSDVSSDIADPITEAVYNIQKGIIDAADYLGIGADAFDAFSTQLKISFKDLKTDEEKSRAIQDALAGLGDEFAGMIVGIDDLSKSGEGAAATLTRLVQSVATVNQWWDRLGFSLYDLSLAGADAASTIVALYGDLETFTSLSGAYYQNFFTQQERTAQAIKEVSASLADLGVGALPASRDAFRALVEAAEIAGNDSLVAGLLKISGAFAEITTASDALAQSLDRSQFTTRAAFEFAKSTLAQGGTDAYESTDTLLLRQLVDAVKQGNLKIIQNTGDTARILTRQDLAPTETVV